MIIFFILELGWRGKEMYIVFRRVCGIEWVFCKG